MENLNMPYLQVVGCRCMPVALNHSISKFISNSPIVDKIDSRRFVGWPIFPEIGGWCIDDYLDRMDGVRISQKDYHHCFQILETNMEMISI